MNEKVPVTNNTAMPIYVGSHMIPPGETRHFDAAAVPEHLKPAPVAPVAEVVVEDPIAALSDKPAKEVIAAIPELGVEALEKLGDLEQLKEKPRSTVLAAISEALLSRADVEALSEKDEAEIIAAIPQLTDQQLEKLRDLEQLRQEPRAAVLDAVTAAVEQRSAT
mgnify:CR=1 FL=1